MKKSERLEIIEEELLSSLESISVNKVGVDAILYYLKAISITNAMILAEQMREEKKEEDESIPF